MNPLNILASAKEIANLIQTYNNQDLYQKIIDLRAQILEMSEENLTLKEKLRELEEQQKAAIELQREGNAYYRMANGKKFGPFCMSCWDGDAKLVNMKIIQDDFKSYMTCGRCE